MAAISYLEIDKFNYSIIKANFLGNIIFLDDDNLQNKYISYILDIIEKEFKKMPEKHIPLAIKEIIQIYRDFSGDILLDYINKSMGVKSNIDDASSNVKIEEKKKDQIHHFIRRMNVISENIKRMSNDIEKLHQNEQDAKTQQQQQSETSDVPSLLSEYKKIKIHRDWHYNIVTKEKHFLQLITYKRLIFLIQVNVYARSKGLYMKEQGYSIDHMGILKDIRDILVFAAPILWPEILTDLQNVDIEKGKIFPFPTNYCRKLIIELFKSKISMSLDNILNIQEFDDDVVTKIPLDSFLKISRVWLMAIINQTDPRIKY